MGCAGNTDVAMVINNNLHKSCVRCPHRPYYGVLYLRWYMHWVWKFNIQKCSYGDEEKAYLTRKRVGITTNQWEVSIPCAIIVTWQQYIGEAKRNELIKRELWIPDHLAAYKKEQEEEMREKMAESTKHKQYR